MSIAAIDARVAEQMPGVRAVLRRGSFPALAATKPDFASVADLEGTVYVDERRPPFDDDAVRYYGQYVALAVADTLEQAKAAADAVRVTYRAEAPEVDPRAGGRSDDGEERARRSPMPPLPPPR